MVKAPIIWQLPVEKPYKLCPQVWSVLVTCPEGDTLMCPGPPSEVEKQRYDSIESHCYGVGSVTISTWLRICAMLYRTQATQVPRRDIPRWSDALGAPSMYSPAWRGWSSSTFQGGSWIAPSSTSWPYLRITERRAREVRHGRQRARA